MGRTCFTYSFYLVSALDCCADGTGHYSQLVWGATSLLGCGGITHTTPVGRVARYYACHYGPAGNYVGQQVAANSSLPLPS